MKRKKEKKKGGNVIWCSIDAVTWNSGILFVLTMVAFNVDRMDFNKK